MPLSGNGIGHPFTINKTTHHPPQEKRNHMTDRRTFGKLIDALARDKRVNTAYV